MKTSEQLLATTPIISTMVAAHHIEFLIDQLEKVINLGVEGDILELGCNQGTTSIFIKKFLNLINSQKSFHVYDSFTGLPAKQKEDNLSLKVYQKGDMAVSESHLIENFCKQNLESPIIHQGWFAQIPDKEYPEKICFAFLDGDFYSSIMDSLNKIYDKLEPGAIVCVHDYGWDKLPGAEKACKDFLSDKPETIKPASATWVGVGFFIKE